MNVNINPPKSGSPVTAKGFPNKTDSTVDPLCCLKCGGLMKIIAFIEQDEIIRKILKHVSLWEAKSRSHPRAGQPPGQLKIDYTESQIV